MDEKFNSVISIALVPQVVDLIVTNDKLDDIAAIDVFYKSKTYELLAKEETKMWHYSPLTIYNIWKQEMQTGDVVFPEE